MYKYICMVIFKVPKLNPCNKRTSDPNYPKLQLYATQTIGILKIWLKVLIIVQPDGAVYAIKLGYETT